MQTVLGRNEWTKGLCIGLLIVVAMVVASGAYLQRIRYEGNAALLAGDDLIKSSSREISVYYPAADTIVQEKVLIDSDQPPILAALRTLFKGKAASPGVKVTVPPASILSVKTRKGIVAVDFDRRVLVTGAPARLQRIVLASILYTVAQFKEATAVSFSVEGKTRGRIAGKDIRRFWGDVSLDEMPWSIQRAQTSNAVQK